MKNSTIGVTLSNIMVSADLLLYHFFPILPAE
jgi:hypothetical protein